MIFFDLDGTLIDFKRAEAAGIRVFHQTYRSSFSMEEEAFYVHWSEVGARHYSRFTRGELTFRQQQAEQAKELFALAGIALTDEESADRFRTYLQAFEANWTAYDDVRPCLEKLRELGVPLGIISNGNGLQQRSKLERTGLLSYFDTLALSGDLGVSKPDPRIFHAACEAASAAPGACLYIGDDLNTDILGCRQAGLPGIWLNRTGIFTEQPVLQIRSLSELLPMLEPALSKGTETGFNWDSLSIL